MITDDIGNNAGKIWNLLYQQERQESMSIREIGKHTHLKDAMVYLALGWLSRESKISYSIENEELKMRLKQMLLIFIINMLILQSIKYLALTL